jgi:hypothetical protein
MTSSLLTILSFSLQASNWAENGIEIRTLFFYLPAFAYQLVLLFTQLLLLAFCS